MVALPLTTTDTTMMVVLIATMSTLDWSKHESFRMPWWQSRELLLFVAFLLPFIISAVFQ